jgi:hypothetical protein
MSNKRKVPKKLKIEPVEFNGETVSELTIRRIKGRDLMRLGKHGGSDMDSMLRGLLPDLIDQTPEFVEEMDAEDVMECIAVIEGFLGRKVAQV